MQFLNPIMTLIPVLATLAYAAPNVSGDLDLGYRQMYNLQFDDAHKTFGECERLRPEDPLGPVSNAAAYLFAEFDRLEILQSEFFTRDEDFKRSRKLTPDPAIKQAFERELEKADRLAGTALARSPEDRNAMFASVLSVGLRSDYSALIEKKYMTSLKAMKNGRMLAEKLLVLDPSYYDAYLAIGVENYVLSLKPAPVRWLLQMGGAKASRQEGLAKLKLTAEKGRYLRPFARLLLAVSALRERDYAQASAILQDLSHQFPDNRLYAEELSRLRKKGAAN